MRRRRLLRVVATAGAAPAAGCLAGRSAEPAETPPASGTETPERVEGTPDVGTTTAPAGVPRRVSLQSVDDDEVRSRHGVAAEVTVTEPSVTDEHTATVEVVLENRTDRDRTLAYVARECGLNAVWGGQVGGGATLVLAPVALDWEPATADCWRAGPRHLSCGIPVTTQAVDLPAGETVAWRFELWATPKGACMPPGRYRFERALAEAGETADGATPDDQAPELQLVLSVAVPDS